MSDFILIFYSGHIQANLEDELVQEALRKGLDLRQYSREIESELRQVELRSIEDCILDLIPCTGVFLLVDKATEAYTDIRLIIHLK